MQDRRMRLDELPGRAVLDSTGRVIGRVSQAVVDLESWAVDSLRVRLERSAANELGMPASFFRPATLDVPTGLVFAASDAVILRATLDELHGLATQPSEPRQLATTTPATGET